MHIDPSLHRHRAKERYASGQVSKITSRTWVRYVLSSASFSPLAAGWSVSEFNSAALVKERRYSSHGSIRMTYCFQRVLRCTIVVTASACYFRHVLNQRLRRILWQKGLSLSHGDCRKRRYFGAGSLQR